MAGTFATHGTQSYSKAFAIQKWMANEEEEGPD